MAEVAWQVGPVTGFPERGGGEGTLGWKGWGRWLALLGDGWA